MHTKVFFQCKKKEEERVTRHHCVLKTRLEHIFVADRYQKLGLVISASCNSLTRGTRVSYISFFKYIYVKRWL